MFKTYLLVILGIVLGIETYLQSKIDYFIDISPNYSFRSYQLMDHSEATNSTWSGELIYENFVRTHLGLEKPKFGYGFTAGVGYSINKDLRIQWGLGYKNIGEKITETRHMDSRPAPVYFTDIYYHSFHYLKMPLDIQLYPWNNKKLSFGFKVGTSIDFFLGRNLNKSSISDQAENKYENADLSKICLSIHGGIQ